MKNEDVDINDLFSPCFSALELATPGSGNLGHALDTVFH